MNWLRSSLVGLLAAFALAVTPAAAVGDTLYASPTGTPADPCTEADPCSLAHAVETEAAANDEVIVLAGNYPTLNSDLTISHVGLTVRGESATQVPQITIDAANGVVVETTASMTQLRDLEISHTGGGISLNLLGPYVIAERLRVTGEGSAVCRPSYSDNPGPFPAVLRDSVCWNGGSGDAVGINLGAPASLTWRLVNVTAIAGATSASGIDLNVGPGCTCTINASNVIALGGTDDIVAATTGTPAVASVVLDHSNYATENDTIGPGIEQITNPGLGTNQTTAPTFAPGLGNFHQAQGSPTIDEGAANPLNGGTLDFDGEVRAQGDSQDIGADEFTVAPPTAGAAGAPPPPPPGTVDLLSANAKGKKLLLQLRCGAAGGCADNLIAVRSLKKIDLDGLAAATKAKRILLAKGSASLASGETATVRLKLRKRGRRLLSARRRVPAKATITTAGETSTERVKVKRK